MTTSYLLFVLFFLSSTVQAAVPKVIFGGKGLDSPFQVGQVRTVVGPLLQLQTEDGTVLALQRGAKFTVNEDGSLALVQGNLRVGPAGMADVVVRLPQGDLKVAPLTAATITAGDGASTGKVYQGELVAQDRTFRNGEGFVLAQGEARGTFAAAAAEAPAVDGAPEDLDKIEPAAGEKKVGQEAPEAGGAPVLRVGRVEEKVGGAVPPVMEAPVQNPPAEEPVVEIPPVTEAPVTETPPVTEQPPVENPPVENPPVETPPVTDEPVTEEPPVETPPVETPPVENPPMDSLPPADNPPVDTPPANEEPVTDTPPVENPPVDNPPVTDEPPVEEPPVVELPPVPEQVAGLLGMWSEAIDGVRMPNGVASKPDAFSMELHQDGRLGLVRATGKFGHDVSGLARGTAEEKDVASDGAVAGLGRWVGGSMVAVTPGGEVPMDLGDGSVHYMWGEKPTNVPVSGHVTYHLLAATQPTYTGSAGEHMSSAGGSFDGTLAIDFAPKEKRLGTFALNGTVTMPQVDKLADGSEVTKHVSYGISTLPDGAALPKVNTGVPADLVVTAPADAAACAGGCAGTLNIAGFGNGMKDVGTLYTINPGTDVGVTGAALFTKD